MVSVAVGLERLATLAESKPVARLAAAFEKAGHELALVGGPVRDAFIGREVHDLDFTTDATPDQILRIVTPITDAQWDIGRAFGTIGARMGADTVEITTYRADSYDGETRKPTVAFGTSLDADLTRRDFTVNAMALRLPSRVLVDPSGGLDDLLHALLRTPSSPETSFGDDPLRMLRAARFTAQLGFEITPDVVEAMTATGITELSSRLVDELSGGQRQRVWVAMALAQQASILLLDEPTTFLDIAHQIELMELFTDLQESGSTLVAVLHDLNQAARYATHLVAMRDGEIVAEGPPSDIVTAELVREVFGLECVVHPDPVTGSPSVTPVGRRRPR